MWKNHDVCDSRPHSVIVTLGGQLYRVLEVVLTIVVSLISSKQCRKVISQTRQFVLFMVRLEGKRKSTTTATASV
jgi:hypothetical protein